MPKYLCTLEAVQEILEPHEALKIMSGVFAALENLHAVGYTHNDIKPNNIMIDEDVNAILIDLGAATKFITSKQHKVQEVTMKFHGNFLFSSA